MIKRFFRKFGFGKTAVVPPETAPVIDETPAEPSPEDSPQTYLIPADYPEVKDPEMPQFELLNGVQAFFLKHYNPKRNCVVQSGTGTGKTVLAYIASRYFLDLILRVILVVPSRALATNQEKMAWGIWGAGVVARNNGKDDKKLESRNFIITTPEGYISAVRQQKEWTRAALLIVDEGHNIMKDRGTIFDAAITLHMKERGKLLIMSGTLPNREALAKFYNADLFVSQFIKTKLNDDPYVECPDDIDAMEAPKKLPLGIVPTVSGYVYRRDSLRLRALKEKVAEFEGQSILIFVPTKAMGYCLSESLVCPFHCADLEEADRNRIVEEFDAGLTKVIVATNTLSEGVNTEADVVIICGSRSGGGKNYFDLNEVKQMFGRAGRKKPEAFAFLLGDRIELAHAKKFYVVNSLPLPVEALGLTMLSQQAATKDELSDLLSETLAASMSSGDKITHAVDRFLHFLQSCRLLKEREGDSRYSLTAEGALVARYFIPPGDYVGFMKVARRLQKVPAPLVKPTANVQQPSLLPPPDSGCAQGSDPAAAAVCMTPEEKGCILISVILTQMIARNCPPSVLKEMKFKLIPLELEEAVNAARAGLLIRYMSHPSAMSPFFRFQINDVARWLGMFKDMVKYGVHAEVPGKTEIEAALKPLNISIVKCNELMRRKAAAQKKTTAPKGNVVKFPVPKATKNIAA